jgi:TldD protein
MRVDAYDAAIDVAVQVASQRGLYVIVRVQDLADRRLVVADGAVERLRSNRLVGIGLHIISKDGSVGFASTDDLRPAAVRAAVEQAGALAEAARGADGDRTLAPFGLAGQGRRTLAPDYQTLAETDERGQLAAVVAAQERVRGALPDLAVRTAHSIVDEQWRIARSDGTDISFAVPRASLRHEVNGRSGASVVQVGVSAGGADAPTTLAEARLATLTQRTVVAARQAVEAADAPPPPSGPCRVVLDAALAKGLAHEAVGHLCESDVDASVLMRGGKLRLGERLARPTVSIVDGPLGGDFASQAISANGLLRETVALIEDGVLAAGLGDLFSAERAGVPITGACRAAGFRDRPTPRMTNTRIVVANPAPLPYDPDDLTPEIAAATLRDLGLLDSSVPTLYLTGYRGGQAHPRRGDFIFAAEAVYALHAGAAPHGPASFSGLAERALASIVAGVGPLITDSIGTCGKDGSSVPSSGGSHALLVLDPDPDLVVGAAR